MIESSWAICRFRFRGPYLVLDYSDNSGEPPLQRAVQTLAPELDRLRPRISRLAERALRRAPDGQAPIAFFYAFPRDIELPEMVNEFFQWFNRFEPSLRIQPVVLSATKPRVRPPIQLPLSILCSSEMHASFGDPREWVDDPAFLRYGLRVDALDGDLELTLRTGHYDIVAISKIVEYQEILRRLPESARPRLIVDVSTNGLPDVRGVAALGADPAPGFLREFLAGLIHDYPLHKALYRARPFGQGFLIANPDSNESLRLSNALVDLNREADRLRAWLDPRSARPVGEFRSVDARRAAASILNVRNLNAFSFDHESQGLLNMARAVDGLRNLAAVPRAPEPAVRRFDAALFRVETAPALAPVTSGQSLEAGAEYELRVHIGSRFPESLVTGELSVIDDLVGPPDDESGGHRLQISVQGKDFQVLGPSTQPLLLPRAGSTDLLYFGVRAPAGEGTKQLRITVHHRNHLVQSFLLSANVAPNEGFGGEIRIEQEFARSMELSNLDGLGERSVFIGMNQGGTTHQVMVMADNVSSELDLGASTYTQAVRDLRQALNDAVIDPTFKLARTYTPVTPGNPPDPDAEVAFRRLARLGRAVYEALFTALPREDAAKAKAAKKKTTRQALTDLQGSSDQKIQVVRFEARSAFPWSLLYDWKLPDDPYGGTPSPVCLGSVLQGGAAVDCTHGPKDRVYCVRGFWGVRHQVEELLEQQRDANQTVTKPASDIIRIAASSTLPQSATLQSNLASACGAVLAAGPYVEDQLLDVLWQKPVTRPAVLIVLGHLETEEKKNRPDPPRVELQASAEWLTLKHLLDRVTSDPDGWEDPRSIVIFAPCEGAAIDEDTLNSFVTALNSAGASAVIGMQSVVGGDQATDFAERLTKLLWANESLGAAIRKVRAETVMAGDPGGFLLQSFGDIDLKLQ